jgi:hypothetical protein
VSPLAGNLRQSNDYGEESQFTQELSPDTRYFLLAWLKMRIEEINSAMTHGKSEA